jgi:PH/SEC7 domain-containing protein
VPNDYQYTGLRIDAALRHFLEHVNLVGESSERARILKHFADRYYECNPTLFDGPGILAKRNCDYLNLDAIHALACALLLLNTDLHGNVSFRVPVWLSGSNYRSVMI